jgi:fumarate reductase flavoprotein subunit
MTDLKTRMLDLGRRARAAAVLLLIPGVPFLNSIQDIIKGYTVTGATYEELGKAMGVDAAAFAETMEKWNGYVEAKNDPDFGRTSFANPLNTAPYYAVKVTAGVHHTMGGLKINANTEVLNEKGEVIPGLFAAGEVTGGVHGANRLGGNAVADFTVFGRIAGAAASDYAA